jgi:hypothetical protein
MFDGLYLIAIERINKFKKTIQSNKNNLQLNYFD